jgi:hypothetical protein
MIISMPTTARPHRNHHQRTYDFEIGRALHNLPALREIGFAANRRLLRRIAEPRLRDRRRPTPHRHVNRLRRSSAGREPPVR